MNNNGCSLYQTVRVESFGTGVVLTATAVPSTALDGMLVVVLTTTLPCEAVVGA